MKVIKKGYLAIALLICQVSIAQEGLTINSEYLADNYYLMHPAMAGIKNSTNLKFTTRQQWSGVDDAPSLMTFNASTRLGEQSAIGLVGFNDKNGYHSQTGFKATYAHHITFSESRYDLNQLSFGLSAGFAQTKLDESEFGGFDPSITGGIELKDSYFSVDVGAAYHYKNFFSMLTVKNAVTSSNKLYSDTESNNYRKYQLGAGYAFGNTRYGTGWIYEPSVLAQYTEERGDFALDVNMKVYRQFDFGKVWAGASFRSNFNGTKYFADGGSNTQQYQYISPMFGGNYKSINFAYSYTKLMGDLTFGDGAFHQFTVGFSLFSKRSSLECNCPTAKD